MKITIEQLKELLERIEGLNLYHEFYSEWSDHGLFYKLMQEVNNILYDNNIGTIDDIILEQIHTDVDVFSSEEYQKATEEEDEDKKEQIFADTMEETVYQLEVFQTEVINKLEKILLEENEK